MMMDKKLNLNIALAILLLLPLQVLGDLNSQCTVCMANTNYQKFCLLSTNSPTGLCCLSTTTSDCLSSYYYCSTSLSSAFSYSKYAFCSFNATLCGTTNRNLRAIGASQSISTGVEMTTVDVCPYHMVSDSQTPFNTKFKITLDVSVNTEVFVLIGTNLDQIET